MAKHYILDKDQNPVLCDDIMVWGKWYAKNSRVLRKTHNQDDSVEVSTVFLGIDHGFITYGKSRPILWETMIFGGKHDQYQERYTSRSDALEGHQKAVDFIGEESTRRLP